MKSSVRRWTEKASLGVLSLAGFVVALADLFGLLDKINGALPKITLLILSTVTLFLLLEIDRLKLLDNVSAQLSKLDIEAIAGKIKSDHYGGVTKVHHGFPDDVFSAYLKSAKREVSILQTWIPNLPNFKAMLEDAVDRGVEVRVLLLQPTSLAVGLRAEALRAVQDPASAPDVRAGVELSLSILASVFDKTGAHAERLQVRVYNSLPAIAVYQADQHYFVSSFLHDQLAINSSQLEIDGNDVAMAQEVQRELDILWKVGRDVDLHDWRRSIETMGN
jgi:hypothetical protein